MKTRWLLLFALGCGESTASKAMEDSNVYYADGHSDYRDPQGDCSAVLWYEDLDGDGAGVDGTGIEGVRCQPMPLRSHRAGDCDDRSSGVHPRAREICDGRDNDCNGLVDDEDPTVEGTVAWFRDMDGDGYGRRETGVAACEGGPNTSSIGGDCDDDDHDVNPGRVEDTTDGVDNNCDGLVDIHGRLDGTWTVQMGQGAEADDRQCVGVYGVEGFHEGELIDVCPDCDLAFWVTGVYDEEQSSGRAIDCPFHYGFDAFGVGLIGYDDGSITLASIIVYEGFSYYGYYGTYYYPGYSYAYLWPDAQVSLYDGELHLEWGTWEDPIDSGGDTVYYTHWWGFEGTVE